MHTDIKTKSEAERLRKELASASPAYTMEPDGVSLDESEWRRQQFKANRLRYVETELVRAAGKMRRDSLGPYNRSFGR